MIFCQRAIGPQRVPHAWDAPGRPTHLEGLAAVVGLLLVPETHRLGRQFRGRLLHPPEMSLGEIRGYLEWEKLNKRRRDVNFLDHVR